MQKSKQFLIPKLIFLCCITTSIVTTLTLSKYQTIIESSDNARVAMFVVEAFGSDIDNFEIDCNAEIPIATYDITVTNAKNSVVSEVAIKYDIIVEFSTALPNEMTISIDNETYSGGQTTYIFEDIGNFTAGNQASRTHTLKIVASSNVKDDYDGTVKLRVSAEQLD